MSTSSSGEALLPGFEITRSKSFARRYTDNAIFLARITSALIPGPGNDSVTRAGHMENPQKQTASLGIMLQGLY